jgi:hypothetical protein
MLQQPQWLSPIMLPLSLLLSQPSQCPSMSDTNIIKFQFKFPELLMFQ